MNGINVQQNSQKTELTTIKDTVEVLDIIISKGRNWIIYFQKKLNEIMDRKEIEDKIPFLLKNILSETELEILKDKLIRDIYTPVNHMKKNIESYSKVFSVDYGISLYGKDIKIIINNENEDVYLYKEGEMIQINLENIHLIGELGELISKESEYTYEVLNKDIKKIQKNINDNIDLVLKKYLLK